MNAGIDMANQAVGGQDLAVELSKTGVAAAAEVVSIQDTGGTVNMNPVVLLGLKVKPAKGDEFWTARAINRFPAGCTCRVGDKIKIKYNKDNPAQFVIV